MGCVAADDGEQPHGRIWAPLLVVDRGKGKGETGVCLLDVAIK